jgi:hypothetical protein
MFYNTQSNSAKDGVCPGHCKMFTYSCGFHGAQHSSEISTVYDKIKFVRKLESVRKSITKKQLIQQLASSCW